MSRLEDWLDSEVELIRANETSRPWIDKFEGEFREAMRNTTRGKLFELHDALTELFLVLVESPIGWPSRKLIAWLERRI